MRSWLLGSVAVLCGCSAVIGLDEYHPAFSDSGGVGGTAGGGDGAGGSAGGSSSQGSAGGSSGRAGAGGGSGTAGAGGLGGISGQGGVGGVSGSGALGGSGGSAGSSTGAGGSSAAAGMGTGGSAGIGGITGAGGAGATGGIGGAGGAETGGAGGTGVVTCDASAFPGDDACVVDEAYGVFAQANAGSQGDGTRAHPFNTLTQALEVAQASGKRVYACADGGPFETLSLDASHSGAKLFGSFKCYEWSFDPTLKSRLVRAQQVVLTMDGVRSMWIEGFEFASGNPYVVGVSSVAAFIKNSSDITFSRVKFESAVGQSASTGDFVHFDFPSPSVLAGGSASGTTPGARTEYVGCPGGGTTVGAEGGLGGDPPGAGAAGTPDLGGGAGGILNYQCSIGGGGATGADGAWGEPGAGATRQGTVTDAGWVPASGELGSPGHVGQGGGGGRGSLESGGGGGGAGGCGGGPGSRGYGGGGSIALLLFNASVSVVDSELVSGPGGDGGSGWFGEEGMAGGAKGLRDHATACDGGDGGKGGRGGSGGGGAGGISAAIVYAGPAPTVISSVLTPGTAGAGGRAATGGHDGVAGLSVAIHDAN